jgi:peptide-methionine (R)-S-oxide reductase
MLNWNDVLKFANNGNLAPDRRVEKTDAEWKALLTPEQYRITRNAGTEARFSGELCSRYDPGKYVCVCCGTELFDSTIKFDSKTGWPSFTQPITENVINYIKDVSYGMTRIEVDCSVCDAHLGHVFPDGPPPSGLRFCINSESLQLVTADKSVPS